jgi:hypothetical protein
MDLCKLAANTPIMKINRLRPTTSVLLLFIAAVFINSCKHRSKANAEQKANTIDSVQQMTDNISRDLSAKGPIAWLDYFDKAPQFFMISDGQLSFQNYPSAEKFIKDTLVKNMTKIALQWKNMRIDLLSMHVASICSGFHEDITMANGQVMPFDGYFSGTAIYTRRGWKLINLHWSTPKTISK